MPIEEAVTEPDIYTETRISMLTPELRQKVRDNLVTSQFQKAGCVRPDGQSWPAWFNHVPIERVRVATGSKDFGMYNHQAGICNWQDRYWYVFSNGADNEEAPGQRTMLTSSQDLVNWSNPTCVAPGDPKGDMWRNTGGVMGYGDRLVVFVQTKTGHSTARKPGMSANEEAKAARKVGVFVSSDGKDWTESDVVDDCHWYEAPKLTGEGKLLCAATKEGRPVVLLWPGDNPLVTPDIIEIPYDNSRGMDSGRFPYGEASWYETDDGKIFMFHRNETDELRLRVALSEDGGSSWTHPMYSNIPDSKSRVSAGRLADGRYFLINNAIADLLNRVPLMISISKDGLKFEKQYFLLNEPTRIEFPGVLKAHGYQYPCALVKEDRLIVAYSVNKEHMELLTVDTRNL
ncbi:MAG TPA: hypothetical protein DIU35_19900 [Candidatus Latescibacteria bacterium]|nr:hypothetical protein [Candidatus Latescibacterota bacterium]